MEFMVTVVQVRAIFLQLEAIYQINMALLHRLQSRVGRWGAEQTIAGEIG
jgi:hypothetical protein